jgi:hypothetical protein
MPSVALFVSNPFFVLVAFLLLHGVCLAATLLSCLTYLVRQGACVAFKPQYIRLAQETTKVYSTVKFFAVSCDDHKDMCKKFSIGSFPTILVFQEGGDQTGTKLKKGVMGRYSPLSIGTALSLTESSASGGADSEQEGLEGVGVVNKRRRVQDDGGNNDDDEGSEGGGGGDGGDGDSIADPDDDGNNNDRDDDDATADETPSNDVMDGDSQDGSLGGGNDDDESAPPGDSRDGLDAASQGSARDDSGEDFDEPDDEDDEADNDGSDNDTNYEIPQKFGGFVGGGQMAGVLGGNGGRPIQPQNGGRSTQPQLQQGMIMQPGQISPPMIGGVGPLGRVKGAGSARAQNSNLKRDMDRWQQMVLERKKLVEKRRKGLGGIIRKNKDQSMTRPRKGHLPLARLADPANAAPETATTAMLARTPGTPEYEERKAAILERIMKARKNGHSVTMRNVETPVLKKENLPFSKDVRKPGLVRKQAERIPFVKRMVKMSVEEELILDASLSFIYGLRYGVYDSDKPLTPDKRRALERWLDLVSVSLPPEWRLHSLIDKLRNRMTTVAMSDKNLAAILDEYEMPRKSWSKSCSNRQATSGFSCGFWKLMHSVTVGIAEHRGGLNLIDAEMVGPTTRTFSPIAAADTMRDYIANFFGCDECRVNFVEKYDQCSNNRRCDRLASDAESSSVADWKELALWLWEVHNEISVRVVTERAEKKQKRFGNVVATRTDAGSPARSMSQMQDQVTALWPDIATCLLCFNDDGHWNEPQVFKMLERTYWYEEGDISLLSFRWLDVSAKATDLCIACFSIFLFLSLFLLFKTIHKARRRFGPQS